MPQKHGGAVMRFYLTITMNDGAMSTGWDVYQLVRDVAYGVKEAFGDDVPKEGRGVLSDAAKKVVGSYGFVQEPEIFVRESSSKSTCDMCKSVIPANTKHFALNDKSLCIYCLPELTETLLMALGK